MRRLLGAAVSVLMLAAVGVPAAASPAAAATPAVLLVGQYQGIPGKYQTIQEAVDAAQPGDVILVGPGDHKTLSSRAPAGAPTTPAAVLITTPHLTLRGMNRNTVIVDGTKSGPPCSTHTADQNFGPAGKGGNEGLNGIMVYKADDVTVQNLTACNFLGGTGANGGTGNEIWWNGGANSQKLGGWGYHGSYLTATSTYYHDAATAAEYGIFSSNWSGGTWGVSYASNFNDSGYYIGACQQACDQTMNHAWAEYNALGYSGSNSGGQMLIENSQFDQNEDGFDTNSQNGDNPPPQNGACPNGKISPITHTHSCWVFTHNYVHDNNNPNVPTAGYAAAGPVGTGMSLSGARNDTVVDNVFENNDAWGTILVPFPDNGPPCTGGTLTPAACVFDEYGDALIDNTYAHNGSYGNPTNGDFAAFNVEPNPPDCFGGNHELGGGAPTSSPPAAQSLYPVCTSTAEPPDANAAFAQQVACDSDNISLGTLVKAGTACLPTDNYPRRTAVIMHPLPGATPAGTLPALENPSSATLTSMANPCQGVPANPWCSGATSSSGTASAAAAPAAPAGGGPGLFALAADNRTAVWGALAALAALAGIVTLGRPGRVRKGAAR